MAGRAVLNKREIVHAVLTGIALDQLAEKKLLPEPLQYLVETDEPLYGIDEIIPLSIVNVYGSRQRRYHQGTCEPHRPDSRPVL